MFINKSCAEYGQGLQCLTGKSISSLDHAFSKAHKTFKNGAAISFAWLCILNLQNILESPNTKMQPTDMHYEQEACMNMEKAGYFLMRPKGSKSGREIAIQP